jgi:hypothetical protein
VHGEPRSTHDIDILIHMSAASIQGLVGSLSAEFFVHPEDVREAVARGRAFNAVHRKLFVKVDLFVSGENLLDREQLERRSLGPIAPDEPQRVFVTSAEVIVLRKLDWFRMTDGTSDRQWRDVLGVLKTSGPSLDLVYLRRTAGRLGLDELLERALSAAGITPASGTA